jgi:hypothetical protein
LSYAKASERLASIADKAGRNENDLKRLQARYQAQVKRVASAKINVDTLEEEKAMTVADIASANKIERALARDAGLAQKNSVDEDLALVRKVRAKANNRAEILEDLAAETSGSIDEYAQYAEKQESSSELSRLLDLDQMIASENKEALSPVKVPNE